jgi:RNA polymerase sigma factor (sigma-70 family)
MRYKLLSPPFTGSRKKTSQCEKARTVPVRMAKSDIVGAFRNANPTRGGGGVQAIYQESDVNHWPSNDGHDCGGSSSEGLHRYLREVATLSCLDEADERDLIERKKHAKQRATVALSRIPHVAAFIAHTWQQVLDGRQEADGLFNSMIDDQEVDHHKLAGEMGQKTNGSKSVFVSQLVSRLQANAAQIDVAIKKAREFLGVSNMLAMGKPHPMNQLARLQVQQSRLVRDFIQDISPNMKQALIAELDRRRYVLESIRRKMRSNAARASRQVKRSGPHQKNNEASYLNLFDIELELKMHDRYVALFNRHEIEYRHARAELVEANLGLVAHIARANEYRDRGLSYSDLVGEGNLGLMKAADACEQSNCRFASLAETSIRASIVEALVSKAHLISLSPSDVHHLNNISHATESLLQEQGRVPTVAEIAVRVDLSIKEVGLLLAWSHDVVSHHGNGEEDSARFSIER